MSPPKKDASISSVGINLDEHLKHLGQTDPKETIESVKKTIQVDHEVRRYVDERKESIRKGARRAPKRFSL